MFGDLKSNPRGWSVVPFLEFAKIDGNMTTNYEKYADYPHIGIDSIEKGTGELKGYRTVREDGVISGKYIFTPQHIIYSKIRPNLNKVALPDFYGVCSADAYPILPNRLNCNRVFLAAVMRSEYYLDYILQFSSRTNLPKVNRKEIAGFRMPLPPMALQNQFATFVAQTDKSKYIGRKRLQNLLSARIILLSYLGISGRRRFCRTMANFSFLADKTDYTLFAPACMEAERIYAASPAMCAAGCRKALELAVKWVYAADETMETPYRDNLQSLIHEPSFRFAVDDITWKKLPFIVRLGNLAVHTGKAVRKEDALLSLSSLFEFIQWLDFCYGAEYAERRFDEKLLPAGKVTVSVKKPKDSPEEIRRRDEEIERLRRQVAELSARYTAEKERSRKERTFVPQNPDEAETRKIYIDVDMRGAGWQFDGPDSGVREEYPLEGMAGVPGQTGYADYVLFGKDGIPLAVVEAKRTCKDPNAGRRQAVLYADCLERKFGRRPVMFMTNGFETYFWDDRSSPPRAVSGIFSREDLQKLVGRREERTDLLKIPIDDRITDRYYQKEAVRAVCGDLTEGSRKHLLVMATGTGKTRTAASLADVLSRGKWVTNVLFLADRTALVRQAKDDFKNYLPDLSLCNLCSNKDDRQARIVFSTYPTILNAIDGVKTGDGQRLFTPAHFDLIIIDESHRSIFKKYRAIFEYFDAVLVGLTATPKTDVDRNTYDFFERENGVPTYAYDYETAVQKDHVLVPYVNYEVKTKFLEEGITYSELSESDKERYEADFTEDDGSMPDFIPSAQLNTFIFNAATADLVLQDLMEKGIKIEGGDRLGKTIIFAQNKRHAEFILERFNALYPRYHGTFAQRIICDDAYAQTVIDDFKAADKPPFIAVSVDMMDTGIDVPECVNLVFFKKVRSKIKFWQMIGRGTRLCRGLVCTDGIDGEYTDKRRFMIFDYCGNFEYFREHQEGYEGRETQSLSEKIFCKRVEIAFVLQESAFAGENYQSWRKELTGICHGQVFDLKQELISVKLQLRYVEKFRNPDAFAALGETEKGELLKRIAPLVYADDEDEDARRFDNFMYGMMLSALHPPADIASDKARLLTAAEKLLRKSTIPQVKAKLPVLQQVLSEDFWRETDVLRLETVRRELRELIKFLDAENRRLIKTDLDDPVAGISVGEPAPPYDAFEDYKNKVNRYIREHGDMPAIRKLTQNIPLSAADYGELERVLTCELGNKADYEREYGGTPFGLLIRKVAKLDHGAAMQAFSAFINDAALNQRQIAFVNKIISHIEQNGYMEDIAELMKPPFDRPDSFVKLFDRKTRDSLVAVIKTIRENALRPAS